MSLFWALTSSVVMFHFMTFKVFYNKNKPKHLWCQEENFTVSPARDEARFTLFPKEQKLWVSPMEKTIASYWMEVIMAGSRLCAQEIVSSEAVSVLSDSAPDTHRAREPNFT